MNGLHTAVYFVSVENIDYYNTWVMEYDVFFL